MRPTSPTPGCSTTLTADLFQAPTAGRPYLAYAPMAGLLTINPGPAIKMPDNPLGPWLAHQHLWGVPLTKVATGDCLVDPAVKAADARYFHNPLHPLLRHLSDD